MNEGMAKLVKTINGMQIREMTCRDSDGYKFLIYTEENKNTYNFEWLAGTLEDAIEICHNERRS